jgi:hypothetical protein
MKVGSQLTHLGSKTMKTKKKERKKEKSLSLILKAAKTVDGLIKNMICF